MDDDDQASQSWVGLIGVAILLPLCTVFSWYLQSRTKHSVHCPFERVARSRFKSVPDIALCAFRGLIALYIFAILLFDLVADDPHGSEIFYFTVWNWTLLGVYFGLTSVSTGLWLMRSPEASADAVDTPAWRRCAKVCQSLSSLCTTNVLMVDVLLWGVLYTASDNKSAFITFTQINMHAVNFPFALAEIIFHDIPCCPSDIGSALVFAIFYAVFTAGRLLVVPDTRKCLTEPCSYYTDGYLTWPYFFLDMSVPIAPLYYVGLFVAQWFFYQIPKALRNHLERQCGRHHGAGGISLV